ncbi:uncharacterized protein LOC144126275 [Amblyomma americanum]
MVGDTQGARQPNRTGVPQGAVISPALFNIAMSGLPLILTSIPGLNFAVYADDITLWTNSGSPAEQELALQTGLNAVHDYIKKCGMKTSPEKTEYVAVINGPRLRAEAERNLISLHLGDSVTCRKQTIRILGMLIDEDGGAKSWIYNTVLSCHQALHLMRRVSARGRGIKEVGLCQIALALITSKILYAYSYMRLNATQRLQLERINRKAMRLVTGLPQFCPVEDPAPCTYHVYTDSLAAYTACRAGGADYAVLSAIRTEARRLREEGYTIVIRWIPAHEGITGNEKAHQAARAAALYAPLPGCTLVSASWARDDVAHPSSPPMDRAETWHRAQCYRRRILQHVANPEQLYHRPPRTFRRVEAVLLRRAQTGQLLSPAKLNLINPHSYPTPQCPACPASAALERRVSDADVARINFHIPSFFCGTRDGMVAGRPG